MFTDEKIEGSKVSEVPSSIANREYKGFIFVTNSVTNELKEMKKISMILHKLPRC